MRHIANITAALFLTLGLQGSEPVESNPDLVAQQQYQEIDDAIRLLKQYSPSFRAKWEMAKSADYGIIPGRLKTEFGTTTLRQDGTILVVVDFDRCHEKGEPVIRVIAHEMQHVSDIATHKSQFVMAAKVDRFHGVSYRAMNVEDVAFKFQAIAYAEYLAGVQQAH